MSNVAGSLVYDTKLDTSDYQKGLDKISANTVAKGTLMADAFKMVAGKIVDVVKSGIEYNATIEQLSTSFEVMTGSAGQATSIVEKLKKMGAETPFEFTDLADATNLLMSFGFESDNAIDTLSMLGDISQGSADKLNTVARAFGKMSSAQKVSLEDINMMIDSGFNPLQEIADTTGESMKSLYDRISKGTMSVDEITKSMQRSTSEGGKYYQSMEKQSKTLNGQMSTLQDNWSNLTGKIAKGVSDTLANDVLPKLNEFIGYLTEKIETTNWTEVIEKIKEFGLAIVVTTAAVVGFKTGLLISSAIDKVTKALNGMTLAQYALNLAMSINPIGLVVAAIAALVAGFIYLWNTNEDFRQFFIDMWNEIVSFFTETIPEAWQSLIDGFNSGIEWLKQLFSDIGQFFTDIWNGIINFFTVTVPQKISDGINAIIGFFQKLPYYIGFMIGFIIGSIANFFINLWNFATVDIPTFVGKVVEWFATLPDKIAEAMTNAWNWIKDLGSKLLNFITVDIPNFINGIINWFAQLPGRIWNAIVSTISFIGNWISNIWNTLANGIPQIINNIIDWFSRLPDEMANIGSNIVYGIWNGITGAAGWLYNKVKSFASGIVDGIKSAMGIHSPSKVMADEVGKFIPAGIGVGIEANTESALKSIDEMNDEIMNKMRQAVNIETAKSSFSGTSGSVSQILSANSVIQVENNNTLELDGEKVYENQQKVTRNKNLQYGFGGAF